MIGWLAALDSDLFLFLNARLTHPVLDAVMPAITRQENWYPILGVLVVALLVWGGKRGRMAVVMLILAVTFADQLSASVLKPLIGRIRPCNVFAEDQFNLLIGCSKAFSFPSAHAANSFAMATVVRWRFPRFAVVFYVIAGAVAYSRVYVGVHYPLDTVAGAALGIGCGVAAIVIVEIVVRLWKGYRERRRTGVVRDDRAERTAEPERPSGT
jgi:undecaprenyl-diphosphatase